MKLLLIISGLFVCIQQFAETRKFIATAYAFSDENSVGEWNDCNVPITWYQDSGVVRIYSEANQRIFYLNIAEFDYDSVKVSAAHAIDENTLKIMFKYIEFKEGFKYIEIDYSNIKYVYALTEE